MKLYTSVKAQHYLLGSVELPCETNNLHCSLVAKVNRQTDRKIDIIFHVISHMLKTSQPSMSKDGLGILSCTYQPSFHSFLTVLYSPVWGMKLTIILMSAGHGPMA